MLFSSPTTTPLYSVTFLPLILMYFGLILWCFHPPNLQYFPFVTLHFAIYFWCISDR